MCYAFSPSFHTQINTSTSHIHFIRVILLPSLSSPSPSLPSSLVLFLYDNKSIMCATHLQLSNTPMLGEADRSCYSSLQIKCRSALLKSRHEFFMLKSITAMHHLLKKSQSPPPSACQHDDP